MIDLHVTRLGTASALLERVDRALRKDEKPRGPKLDGYLVKIEQALG